MKRFINENVTYLKFDIYEEFIGLTAVHSTRLGGVSRGNLGAMNLGFKRGDTDENVYKNYELFCSGLNINSDDLVLSDQWHHNNILIVDKSHLGMGIHKERSYGDVDGLVTDIKSIPLVTFYADCTPIYFYDAKKEVIGMCHAGWRGTATAIVKDMVKLLCERYSSELKDIYVGIGPAICQSCYQVTKEVIDAMKFDFDVRVYYFYNEKEDRYYIDLKAINRAILISEGIDAAHIEVTDLCTKCNEELFHSHRRTGNDRGTQIGLMIMEA